MPYGRHQGHQGGGRGGIATETPGERGGGGGLYHAMDRSKGNASHFRSPHEGGCITTMHSQCAYP